MNDAPERELSIGGRLIGPAHPPFIVAELSSNHKGEIKRALALLEAAKEAGADAVKLQTYTADTITIDHDGPGFRIEGGLWDGRTLYQLYQEAHTPWEWHEELFAKGRELGLTVFSSPFDHSAIDLLESLDAPAYKIASFEVIDLPLIKRAAAAGKPLVISTGMANLDEIREAVGAARRAGCESIALLHCTSGYPTPPEDTNLRALPRLAQEFDVVAGLSDHTRGIAVAVTAIAFGAAVIEKHFTLRRSDGGPDAEFSLEPDEFAELADGCRTAWAALGRAEVGCAPSEKPNKLFRRSLYVVEDIPEGERFTPRNLRSIRPGYGLAPKHLPEVLGRRAARRLTRGTPLDWSAVGD